MTVIGTWLVLLGSALAVLQSVWVIVDVGRARIRLRLGKAYSDSREDRISQLRGEIRARWGDDAADVSNYDASTTYPSEPELESLRIELEKLIEARSNEDWVRTHAAIKRERAKNAQELLEVEREWQRLWTQGVPGLIGGLMALVGGLLLAWGTTP